MSVRVINIVIIIINFIEFTTCPCSESFPCTPLLKPFYKVGSSLFSRQREFILKLKESFNLTEVMW